MRIPAALSSKLLLATAVSLGVAACATGSTTPDHPTGAANEPSPMSAPLTGTHDAGSAELPAGGRRGSTPFLPSAPSPSSPIAMPYRGVNLAGAELGDALPGREGVDYRWPTPPEVDYYLSKGMNTFRIGFKWERLQPNAYDEFDPNYVMKMDAIVGYATSMGARVILEPHNFARYYGKLIGSDDVPVSAFADFWCRLAQRHAANPAVAFNLVNEPNSMPTEQWVDAANAGIGGIRSAGAPNLIIVPGNNWTGAYSWDSDFYGTPNSKAMLDIYDPIDNAIFEVHQYLDKNSSGTEQSCVSETIGRERLAPFIAWLRQYGKKGFVGEFAGGNNAICDAAVGDMLSAMMDASDVLVGWLWWAAGPAWGDSYPFSLEPVNGQDRPQMALLAPHLR
jgi:endoglucanase